MRIGVTGHQQLVDERWVRTELESFINQVSSPLEGISSLAAGADQIFAQVVLANRGKLHVVLPIPDYERTFTDEASCTEYTMLLANASTIEVLPKLATDEESFFAAGQRVVSLSDVLVAVWDAQPAAGFGGTADVVCFALQTGKRVYHINPVSRTTADLTGA